MASLLRSVVAGPRLRHVETGLDLCYFSESKPTLIAMSMPASSFPTTLYRNPLDRVLSFLKSRHGENWHIWELRAEGSGYNDEEFHGRVFHAPWPDHHPPPFGLIPKVLGSMRGWVEEGIGAEAVRNGLAGEKISERNSTGGEGDIERVIVVHCKAGKGRSGTILTSYLISEHGYSAQDAMALYTAKRMRPVFGAEGVSIPSQRRYVQYVERWARQLDKVYVERRLQVTEIKVWGLRDGVRVTLSGYIEGGMKRKDYWGWKKRSSSSASSTTSSAPSAILTSTGSIRTSTPSPLPTAPEFTELPDPTNPDQKITIFKPTHHHHHHKSSLNPGSAPLPIILSTSDINISFTRHIPPPLLPSALSSNLTLTTSIAHVWFNAYFESIPLPTENGEQAAGGVPPLNSFVINWEAMDGVKGTSTKGSRCFERMEVKWEFLDEDEDSVQGGKNAPVIIKEGDGVEELLSRRTPSGTEIVGDKEEEEQTLGLKRKVSSEGEVGELDCDSSVSSVEGAVTSPDGITAVKGLEKKAGEKKAEEKKKEEGVRKEIEMGKNNE